MSSPENLTYLCRILHSSSQMNGKLTNECECMLITEFLVESIKFNSKISHQVDGGKSVDAGVLRVSDK
jgi:hypothetical protein